MSKIEFKPGNMLYPLPVVLVTSGTEKTNIITIAWCGTTNSNPPMVSISVKEERYSYHLIDLNKEFVINIPDESLAYATDYCGVKSGKDIDKFKVLNLHELDIEGFKTKGILEAKVNIACIVSNQIKLGSHTMFIGEVKKVLVNGEYMDQNNRFCFENIKPICYSHGKYYNLGQELGKFGFSVKKEK